MMLDTHLLQNLRWDAHGGCYATWQLAPLRRARTATESERVASSHHELFRAFIGRRFWLESLVVWGDPISTAERMIAGVDLAEHPAWAATVDAALDHMDGLTLGRRRHFLTVKLRTTSWLATATRTAANTLLEACGVQPLQPTRQEITAAMAEARAIEQRIPEEFNPTAATPADIIWLRRHAQTRVGEDLTTLTLPAELSSYCVESAGATGSVHLDPCGISELPAAERVGAALRRRWIRVSDDQGSSCVQAHLVLAKSPGVIRWPDSEFLGLIDDAGVPVDLCVTGVVRSGSAAQQRNQSAMKRLNGQLGEAAADPGEDDVASAHEDRFVNAAHVLTRYDRELAADSQLVEVEAVVIASVAGVDGESVDEQALAFTQAEVNRSFRWARVVGVEDNLFWARQPGPVVPAAEVRQYRQITHSRTVGSAAVVTSHELGDDTGIPFAVNHSSSLRAPVMIEPFGVGDTYKQMSPSMGVVGAQGSGKTLLAKTWAGHMVDRGALLLATDTSPEREWFRFATSLQVPMTGVDLSDPSTSCDPLRIFPPKQAGPIAQSFLITLLDLSATDVEGRVLAKMLRPDYLRTHDISSLGGLMAHLQAVDVAHAAALGDRMEVFADARDSSSLAAAVFDETLPPMDVDHNQVFIWGLYGTPLPTSEEMASPQLFRQLPVDKLFGRACFALFARFAQQMQLRDDSPSLQNLDEYHGFALCAEAHQVTMDMVRVGRHTRTAVSVQSQLPRDLLGLKDLLRVRVAFKPTDPEQAREMATFLGDSNPAPESHEALVQEILVHNAAGRGAGVMRDSHDRIGRIQTFMPFTEQRRRAASTSEPAVSR